MSSDLYAQIKQVVRDDPRYRPEAYRFVFEGLEFTLQRIGEKRHVSGQELLAGLRALALQEFGMLAKLVFHRWGVTRTEDFGEIVFNLVEAGMMGRTEQDSRGDFRDGFDFEDAFWIQPRTQPAPMPEKAEA